MKDQLVNHDKYTQKLKKIHPRGGSYHQPLNPGSMNHPVFRGHRNLYIDEYKQILQNRQKVDNQLTSYVKQNKKDVGSPSRYASKYAGSFENTNVSPMNSKTLEPRVAGTGLDFNRTVGAFSKFDLNQETKSKLPKKNTELEPIKNHTLQIDTLSFKEKLNTQQSPSSKKSLGRNMIIGKVDPYFSRPPTQIESNTQNQSKNQVPIKMPINLAFL